MQCARAIPVTWLGSGSCQARTSSLNTNEWMNTHMFSYTFVGYNVSVGENILQLSLSSNFVLHSANLSRTYTWSPEHTLIALLENKKTSALLLNFKCNMKQCNKIRHYHCRLQSSGDLAVRLCVISNRRFETARWSHLQRSKCPWRMLHGPLNSLQNLGTNHPETWCHIPEEQRPQVLPREDLTSHFSTV